MTEAEKMAEEFCGNFEQYEGSIVNPKGPITKIPQDEITQFIRQVAERTREECYRMTVKKMEVTKYTGWKPFDDCLLAIRCAHWEDKEV